MSTIPEHTDGAAPADSLLAWITHPASLTLPDFHLSAEELRSTLAAVLTQFQQDLEAIASDESPADFYNTVVALEKAMEPLRRMSAVAGVLQGSAHTDDNSDALAEIDAELSSAFLGVELNSALFNRLEAINDASLLPEDRRHLQLLLADFIRAGARLDDDGKQRVEAVSAELTRLENRFANTVLAETNASAFVIERGGPYSPDGLTEAQLAAAAAQAQEHGVDGWVLPLESTTVQPPAESLTDPETRSALFAASADRCSRGGEGDTRGLVADITALRAALAGVLGYSSFSEYAIEPQQAGSPEQASSLLISLLEPANQQLQRELATIEKTAQPQRLAAEDIPFWLRRVGSQLYGIDHSEISKYFEFNRVLHDGVFYAASVLYGLSFENVTDRFAGRLWDETVTVWEISEGAKVLGLVCIDPYTRPSKRGGAWMAELVTGARLTGEQPIITMTMNVPRPAPGEPALLSLDDVNTLFHEFGHVWHGLFADSTYPSRAGTSVPRDYVEFPSQLNEMWMLHPDVLPNYARHITTGEPLPENLVEQIKQAQKFGQGFGTIEYLAAALLDLSWHGLEPGEQIEAVLDFESEVLSAAGFSPSVQPRYRSPYFMHAFSFGYAAGYYSYLWSEQLAAYVSEWFDQQGGLKAESGQAFRRSILAPGFSVDPEQAITQFFGEQPTVDPLLRRRGLPTREQTQAEVPVGSPADTSAAAGSPADTSAPAGSPAQAPAETRPEAPREA
ncbi:peptidyl-dipeptidase Dcp [Brevibacterium sp. HMSC08F02]|uniref:M3 family metallopeptidase n=1 Tax=Brevibacterium sp. HMSC08F02 TaxID=1581140 RepID=UPI0008A57F15|nr:M3 family metallopeptidase [Brevibacterium sp. HMSC08F02]OFT25011.1 peptidyl-dipeptidase Dcp [Brevibacterium sp. HMSC08F02]